MTTYPIRAPHIGEIRVDSCRDMQQQWTGTMWEDMRHGRPTMEIPTDEDLEKFPALKTAWEEFLTIKKLTGV